MNKKILSVILFCIAGLLAALFVTFLIIDYIKYYPFGSAPFWLYIAERFVELGIAAAVCLAAGLILRKGNR